MTSDKDDLTAMDKAILGKCGVFCLACDAYLGKAKGFAKELFDNLEIDEKKIKKAAKDLLEILDQVNYGDVVGFLNLGVNAKEYEQFQRFLKIIAEETGESYGRTISFNLETGQVTVKTIFRGVKEV